MKKEKLHTIAPLLSQISSKEKGFTVPKNYFNTVEENVISILNLQEIQPKESNAFKTPAHYFDTVEEITLAKLKAEIAQKNNNTKIPAAYFNTVEDRVFAKLKADKKVISIKKITTYAASIAIAASLLLVFILNTTKKEPVTFASLEITEIEAFINNGMVDIEPENLANAFSDIEFPTTILTTSLTENEVYDYLTDEDIETIIYEN
ncbi:hypothetical protein EC396_10250 [Lutibacter sp. HS1-25]|uniref:hypothetical protein n=1 Tax=Lutibacter sp. HS1-25 TaxID=2485000 RepID=UPI0010118CB5|nr:hypothetical protein [Lutibacter sp. HS1-25]RXP53468.1 hypothetical protein EC396_10250 [Lutibacter sp. HS1-25]